MDPIYEHKGRARRARYDKDNQGIPFFGDFSSERHFLLGNNICFCMPRPVVVDSH